MGGVPARTRGCGLTGLTVPFNRATLAPEQMELVREAFESGWLAGDGQFTERAAAVLTEWSGGGQVLLTPSCTDALEMSALLLDIGPGDEVIVPSFTFVSTANAYALFGARPVFADSDPVTLNITAESIAAQITPRTKAIVVVHYGGVACDMDGILRLAGSHGIPVIEDNAHGLLGSTNGSPLGSFGAMATLSFHETKNFSSGEGGALVLNDPAFVERAEILREKGTNRSRFFRGQVDKYTWVDKGSSFLLADPLAAVLCAQFAHADVIQDRRHRAWRAYADGLSDWARRVGAELPVIPSSADHPAHLYWMWMPSLEMRTAFISHMRAHGVQAVFHYQALHEAPMGASFGADPASCPVASRATTNLVRLPVFSDMRDHEIEAVLEATSAFQG